MKKGGLALDTEEAEGVNIDAAVVTPTDSALNRLRRMYNQNKSPRDRPVVSPRHAKGGDVSPRSAIRLDRSPRGGTTPKGEDRFK